MSPAATSSSLSELPIDIDYAKFLSWLIDRRRVSSDWHSRIKSARILCSTAMDSTSAQAKEVLPDRASTITYFRARKVLQRLTEAAAISKYNLQPGADILGRPRDPCVRAWSAAVRAYQVSNAHLADCAQFLATATDVHANALIKARDDAANTVLECARRERINARAAEEANKMLKEKCDDLGIVQHLADFERQIEQRAKVIVPETLKHVVSVIANEHVQRAVEYYAAFKRFLKEKQNGNDIPDTRPKLDADMLSDLHVDHVCPALRAVREGDVNALVALPVEHDATPAGLRKDDVPPQLVLDDTPHDGSAIEIDWGISIGGEGADADLEKHVVSEDAGLKAEMNMDANVQVAAPPEGGIDWGDMHFEVEETSNNNASRTEGITLRRPEDREAVRRDLAELRAFLITRKAEIERTGTHSAHALVMQAAGGVPDCEGPCSLDEILRHVEKADTALGGTSMAKILEMENEKGRMKVVKGIEERRAAKDRMERAVRRNLERKEKAILEGIRLRKELRDLGKEVRECKEMVEQILKTIYKGRQVNLVGDINTRFERISEEQDTEDNTEQG